MTGKTRVRFRPDNSPWHGTWGGRGWEHHCHRPECANRRSAWTWHLSWRSAMGMAWSHIHRYHHDDDSP